MSDLFRSGRGGAGNFHTKNDIEELKKAEDLESQSQIDPSSTSINDLTRSISATKPPPEYLHTGRGGAGNWVQPKELHSQGLTQESTLSGQDASSRALGSSKPTYRGGRGGAGNYGSFEEEERLKREAEEKKRAEVERAVERDVESGLARPERAYGGKGGSWEMGSMGAEHR
ncbi:uncharacterized protein LY89DRAFT_420656 [Mollisia scopiformis]|uniref:Uncharacterized protein n=1 Tax=Mollisia scopiformis TaxID=149040 RepID=A0A194XLE9_MOLSC|nr:uncharacterized protein LY89DRAFT_420656 [Mollisia scopiformis]KUJ20956.1 hypothetical protein LY89DRAFT_420656 [Mollisia scopiformis]